MPKIAIPYYHQQNHSQDCGPVCVQMILEHFGSKTNLEKLRSGLTYTKTGTSAYNNATLFLKNNLQVTAITAHPFLFPPDKINQLKNDRALLNYLSAFERKTKKYKLGVALMKKFIKAGGKIKMEIPTERHIQKAIDGGALVFALMYARTLGSDEGGFHFVVVSGYKKGFVFVNNPLLDSKQQGWFPIDRFLYGLHASVCADIDNGTLMIVTYQV